MPGISFRETMSGGFALGATDPRRGHEQGAAAGTRLAMHATIDIRDIKVFMADPQHAGGLAGRIDFAPLGLGMLASHGIFKLFAPSGEGDLRWMVYELGFRHQGKSYYVAGKKEVRGGPVWRLWRDTTTLFTRLYAGDNASGEIIGAGVLSLGIGALLRLLSTLRATSAASLGERVGAIKTFGGFFARELWRSYVHKRK